ncbi:MAG: ATP-binding protein [Gammaproteobacteria bacterium]
MWHGCGVHPRPALCATTKGNAGMGIGVFESREIVRSLGGEIQVASRPHSGTTFRITLPLAAYPGAVSPDRSYAGVAE